MVITTSNIPIINRNDSFCSWVGTVVKNITFSIVRLL